MKKIIFLLIFMLVFVSLFFINSVYAMNTGFETQKMEDKDIQTLLENIKVTLKSEAQSKDSISCFDINDDGWYAFGIDNAMKKQIDVYNSLNEYQYSYLFSSYGSFGLEWDNDNIIIYFVRGDVAVEFDNSGNFIEALEIKNSIENNSYWNYNVNKRREVIGDTKYIIRNDLGLLNFFAASYSQLVKIDADGKEKILYDVNSSQLIKMILMGLVVILFATIVISAIVKNIINNAKADQLTKEIQR